MTLDKLLEETLADIARYGEDQELLTAGMKKGARELYERIRNSITERQAEKAESEKPDHPESESGRARTEGNEAG